MKTNNTPRRICTPFGLVTVISTDADKTFCMFGRGVADLVNGKLVFRPIDPSEATKQAVRIAVDAGPHAGRALTYR